MPVLPQTNISMQDIQDEFGGDYPIMLDEYYSAADDVPESGQISIGDFRGKENWTPLTGQNWSTIGTTTLYVPQMAASSPFSLGYYSLNSLLSYVAVDSGFGSVFTAGSIPMKFGPSPHDDITGKTEVKMLSSDGKIVTFRRDSHVSTSGTVVTYNVSAKKKDAQTFAQAALIDGASGGKTVNPTGNQGAWAVYHSSSGSGPEFTTVKFIVPNSVFPHTSSSATALTVNGRSAPAIWAQAQDSGAIYAEEISSTHTGISTTFDGNFVSNAISCIALDVTHPTTNDRIVVWRDATPYHNDNVSRVAKVHYEVV